MTIEKKYLLSEPVLQMLKDPKAIKARIHEGGSFQEILGFQTTPSWDL